MPSKLQTSKQKRKLAVTEIQDITFLRREAHLSRNIWQQKRKTDISQLTKSRYTTYYQSQEIHTASSVEESWNH